MKLSPLVGCSWLANLSVKVNGDLDGTVVTQLTLTTDEMGAVMRMFQYSQRITVSVCNRGNCRIYLGIQFSPFPYLSGLLAPLSM